LVKDDFAVMVRGLISFRTVANLFYSGLPSRTNQVWAHGYVSAELARVHIYRSALASHRKTTDI